MAKLLEGDPRTPDGRATGAPAKEIAGRACALELVALRGRDVLGVRHVLDGGKAWVGEAAESLVRVSLADFGGEPFVVGEAAGGRFLLHVPPRARARSHGADGLARLVVGPEQISLGSGERAVVVLGPVQIRARIVPVTSSGRTRASAMSIARWLGAIGAVYAAVLVVGALATASAAERATAGAARDAAAWALAAGELGAGR
jgi:hypothetical protein